MQLLNVGTRYGSQWEQDVATSRYETWDMRCPDEDCDGHYETVSARVEIYMGQAHIVDDIECPYCDTEMEVW